MDFDNLPEASEIFATSARCKKKKTATVEYEP
jgi:hypothetical protein